MYITHVFLCRSKQEGDGVVINQPDQFAKAVLPKYYKHSNYQSFVRQVYCRVATDHACPLCRGAVVGPRPQRKYMPC